MKIGYYFFLFLFVISSCKKDDGAVDNNNGNNSTTFSGLWYSLPGLQEPDYATSTGPSVWINNTFHNLVFNKFARLKYLELADDLIPTIVSTPFENEQNINFPCMATDGENVFLAYSLFLGDTRVYTYLRNGNNWETLPEISAPDYSFNNTIMAAALDNGKPYLLAQSTDSTYVFTYTGNNWQVVGGKAIGPNFYYVDLKTGGGRILALGYNPPSGNNTGLKIYEWKEQQWTDAGFQLENPVDEIIFPNMDINNTGVVVFNFMSNNGSFIYKQQSVSSPWEKIYETDASSQFAFRPRFDKTAPAIIYALLVTHPVQINLALQGLLKFDGSAIIEYQRGENDLPANNVVFNPIKYSTSELIPHGKKIHFSYTEDRTPNVGHRVLFIEE